MTRITFGQKLASVRPKYEVFGGVHFEDKDVRVKTLGFWEVFEENRWSKKPRTGFWGQTLSRDAWLLKTADRVGTCLNYR